MARIDAMTAIGKKFHVDKVTTAKDGKTITIFLHRPIHMGQGAIQHLLDGTGYALSGFGNSVEKGQYFLEIIPMKGQTE